ncbi:hypothetical protein CGLAU_04920 [Corynebacterium glaucum]|uniref:Cell division protein DivIVA n=1 Tax=Corynebacterium glaucum TaxID=187491 RepID=A0A1Q2HVT4_9CORY|nr:cell division protein DivIVA [Corynebacterium glaucum]AQQ14958.1 hypothetical protein CGLAU_04920 [Corynebacterium glaucum]
MLSWIMLIIALIVFSVLGLWLFSAVFGRGEALPPMMETADVKEANRRAVDEGRIDDIQLEVVHRGYRMDQVDALIAQLTGTGETPAQPVVEPATLAAAEDGDAQKSVDSSEVMVRPEGEPTHGSNETAHR